MSASLCRFPRSGGNVDTAARTTLTSNTDRGSTDMDELRSTSSTIVHGSPEYADAVPVNEIERELRDAENLAVALEGIGTALFERFATVLDTSDTVAAELGRAHERCSTDVGTRLQHLNAALATTLTRLDELQSRCRL